ncbi:cob(I)yrinic acid a,c-diamide adenosyltransferase [bacterium]|nr:cob(I)yrinic acid a,c-diamide adenosyltransferase [bacterium]
MKNDIEYLDSSETEQIGLVFIMSGDGKGKTAAAIGMAIRASGWNIPLTFIQLMKKRTYGEIQILENLGDKFDFFQMGREKHVVMGDPSQEDIDMAKRAMKMARESMESRQFDMVILDEVLTAMQYELITEEDILDLIKARPPYLHLVLTGRGVTPALIDAADCVTIMEKVKHHFDKGVPAQKGIEF